MKDALRRQHFANVPPAAEAYRETWRKAMTKIIRCSCGYVMRSDNQDELVAAVRRHARELHGMELTVEQALAMARPE
jgi:predicted small metal-binding protein